MSQDRLSLQLEAAAKSYVAARRTAHSTPLVVREMHSFLCRFGLGNAETAIQGAWQTDEGGLKHDAEKLCDLSEKIMRQNKALEQNRASDLSRFAQTDRGPSEARMTPALQTAHVAGEPARPAKGLEVGKGQTGGRRPKQHRKPSIRGFTDDCDGAAIKDTVAALPPETQAAMREGARLELSRQGRWGRGADPRYDLNRHAALARIVAALERSPEPKSPRQCAVRPKMEATGVVDE
ncbi:MAG: hypothetical protein VYD57_07255 [Pseudomonadota bacterium]|nr:hypothetical protein [Pseudomonadota bacterium]